MKTSLKVFLVLSVLISISYSLPEGNNGIAAKYLNDQGIANDSQVIYANGFEAGKGDWDVTSGGLTAANCTVITSDFNNGASCLRNVATLATDTGVSLHKFFSPGYDEMYARWYVKFDNNFDYLHHFTQMAHYGSMGNIGYGAGLKPNGTDYYIVAVEPHKWWNITYGNMQTSWGSQNPAPGAWQFYNYFYNMFQDTDTHYYGNSMWDLNQTKVNATKDKWICVELMGKANTGNNTNAESAFWIDGKLIQYWKGQMQFRTSDTVKFDTFWLLYYVTTSWTSNPVNTVYIDDVVVAKSYIGPIATSVTASTTAAVQEIRIKAFPNPCNINKAYGRTLKMEQLPSDTSIKIFNAGGELVREILPGTALNSRAGYSEWDFLNANNEMVPSGTYNIICGNRRGKVSVVK